MAALMTGIGVEEGEVGVSTMIGIDTVAREVAHRKDDGGRMTVSAEIQGTQIRPGIFVTSTT